MNCEQECEYQHGHTESDDAPRGKPQLRLLKVVVQPVYVLDDGETLTEQPAQPATIPAKDWPSFAKKDPLTWIDLDN